VNEDLLDKWRTVFQKGGIKYFDIANIHYISSGDKYSFNVKPFKALVDEFEDKPLWVTEAEVRNVRDLDLMTQGAINAGAEKILYTTLYIGGDKKPGPNYSKEYQQMSKKCPR
jgi:hypothetical protein